MWGKNQTYFLPLNHKKQLLIEMTHIFNTVFYFEFINFTYFGLYFSFCLWFGGGDKSKFLLKICKYFQNGNINNIKKPHKKQIQKMMDSDSDR